MILKETKNFFNNNRLNKGYDAKSISKKSDLQVSSDKYKHILPNIDIIAEYEELSPGSIDKIFAMAKEEQKHQHKVNLEHIANSDKAMRAGRICLVAVVAIISLTTLVLAFAEYYVVSSVFSVSSFTTIALISFLQNGKFIDMLLPKFSKKSRVTKVKDSAGKTKSNNSSGRLSGSRIKKNK